MGHCSDEIQQNSNTKLTEKPIETNPKEKVNPAGVATLRVVKKNTYDKIKDIVLGNGKTKKVGELGGLSPQPQKNKININL